MCLVLFLVGCVAMLSDAFGTRQEWIHQERKNAQTDEPSDLKRKADDIPVRPSVNDEKLAFPASKAIAYCKVKRPSNRHNTGWFN